MLACVRADTPGYWQKPRNSYLPGRPPTCRPRQRRYSRPECGGMAKAITALPHETHARLCAALSAPKQNMLVCGVAALGCGKLKTVSSELIA